MHRNLLRLNDISKLEVFLQKVLRLLFLYSVFILFAFVIHSCKDKERPPSSKPDNASGVLISNEGTFNFNTASLGWFDLEKEQYMGNIFSKINQKPLGDVLQSVLVTTDQLWLVLNNSNKVVVLSRKDFKQKGEIKGLQSPRYLLPVDDDFIWVSDLKSGEISVLNRHTLSLDHTFDFKPGWSEQMIKDDEGVVWVTHPAWYNGESTRYIYAIDIQLERIIDSIEVMDGPTLILPGPSHTAWVYCQGHEQTKAAGGIVRVSLADRRILGRLNFPGNEYPLGAAMSYDSIHQKLYFLHKDVYTVSADQISNPPERIIESKGKSYYSLQYIEASNELYVGDAVDFVQTGVVERYTVSGTLISTFRSGVIPNGFYYLPN